VLLFFFSIGTIIGTLKSKITGIITLLSCWFVLLYFIPTAVNTYVTDQSDLITPISKLEIEKMRILMGFERRTLEKAGISKHGEQNDSEREMILSYWNNEYVKLQALEEDMENQMEANISLFQKLSMFFPSTFYLSITNEVSSRGYENFLDFYKVVRDYKRKFFKFYMDKVYFSNFSEVEPFVKRDENIFPARSRLPRNFIAGVSVNFFYVVALFWLSHYCFRKSLFMLPKNESPGAFPRNMKLKKGEFKVLVSEGDLFKNQLFNLFSGETGEFERKGFTGEILIDDIDITAEKNRDNFLYLCHPEDIPGDIKAADFLSLTRRLLGVKNKNLNMKPIGRKKFSRLQNHEKGEVLLAVLAMKGKGIYLVHDAARGMPIEFTVQLKEKMEALKEEGALVLYFTPDELINVKSLKKGQKFYESATWCQLVDHYKDLLDIQ
jgi:hypothetical protein